MGQSVNCRTLLVSFQVAISGSWARALSWLLTQHRVWLRLLCSLCPSHPTPYALGPSVWARSLSNLKIYGAVSIISVKVFVSYFFHVYFDCPSESHFHIRSFPDTSTWVSSAPWFQHVSAHLRLSPAPSCAVCWRSIWIPATQAASLFSALDSSLAHPVLCLYPCLCLAVVFFQEESFLSFCIVFTKVLIMSCQNSCRGLLRFLPSVYLCSAYPLST